MKGILLFEEIEQLYEKLHNTTKEERENLWKIIIEKNEILFNKRKEELNKVITKYEILSF